MFSLRGSTRVSRKNLKAEADNGNGKSFDSIDKIVEESGSRKNSSDVSHDMRFVTSKIHSYTRSRNSSYELSNGGNESAIDVEFHSNNPKVLTSTPLKRRQNPFEKESENANTCNNNGVRETHFEWKDVCESELISQQIVEQMLDTVVPPDPASGTTTDGDDDTRYDDRKNPFMDEVYDDSLLIVE